MTEVSAGDVVRPTMMDVAAKAGVSQSTVSLILNSSPGVRFSDATRKKVHEAAEALGYHFVRRPAVVKPDDARVIGFIVDDLSSDPWMAMAFEGARGKAEEHGLTLMLAVSGEAQEQTDEVLSRMMALSPLGLIYGTILTRRLEPPKALFERPCVLVNCFDSRRALPSVVPADLLGGRAATERLIRAGRRRIAMINGQDGIDTSRDRLRGYREALNSNDLPFDPALVRPGNWEPSTGYDGARALMALQHPPDAIFCANDLMAMGCYDALRELGLRIPDDISVIGFDNREQAQFMRPGLTTLTLPHLEMGAMAVELLMDRVGGLERRHNQIKVECPLVERDSVEWRREEG